MALKQHATRRSSQALAGLPNSRGQAALTDALYFLMIVSIISTMLFFYASNYGLTLQQRVSNQYWQEYTTGALETILYSSTPRIAGTSLESTAEVDYLLAAVKEDFAEDGEIDETGEILKQNIFGIMQPVSGSFDYLFYFYLFDEKKFPFVMLYTKEAPAIEDGKIVKHGDAKIYFCQPKSLDDLQKIAEKVGASSSSNARVQFIEITGNNVPEYPPAEASLSMWIPTPLEEGFIKELNCEQKAIPAP